MTGSCECTPTSKATESVPPAVAGGSVQSVRAVSREAHPPPRATLTAIQFDVYLRVAATPVP